MFRWELTQFLESIESPFVSFDGAGYTLEKNGCVNSEDENKVFAPVVFDCSTKIYQFDKNEASPLAFSFPLPDLYLNRPLVLKYYVESQAEFRQLILNGSYLVASKNTISNKNKNSQNESNLLQTEMKAAQCYALCDGNEVMDNHLFPMEMLLANEEINYWHGDYWYKHNNWIFSEYDSRVDNYNVPKEPSLFALFDSIPKEQVQNIIGDLSDQTGISSKFRRMISFRMSTQEFDQLSKNVDDAVKQSRNDDLEQH